jgi:hypothetical protein
MMDKLEEKAKTFDEIGKAISKVNPSFATNAEEMLRFSKQFDRLQVEKWVRLENARQEIGKVANNAAKLLVAKMTELGEQKLQFAVEVENLRRHNQDEIAELRLKIGTSEKKLQTLEVELKQLSTPEVNAYILKLEKERAEAHAKALALMKEVLGQELFSGLQDKKWCTFTAKDGGSYKITSQGYVFRRINNEWKKLCIIRPKELPLPDFVLAALINVREKPKSYNLRYRR